MLPSTPLLDHLTSTWTDLAAPTRIGIVGLGVFLGVQLWNMIPPKDSHHDEPPYLPYSIPWVGHTLAFARDSSRVFHTALQRFGLQPFTLKIAGQKHYVLTHPSDVQAVFKASRSLTFDGSTAQVLKLIYGMSDDPDISVEEMLHGGKHLADGTIMEDPHTWFRRELSGKALELMTERSVSEIHNNLDVEFDRLVESTKNAADGKEELGALLWARNLLSDAVTAACFGPTFLKRFPRTIDALWEMDDGTYKLMYGIPEMFAKEVYAAREELVEVLKTYLGDTEEGVQLRKGALPIVVGREEVMKLAGVSLDGRARGVLTILQAFHTNSAPTSFWFILYCVLTPGLLPRVLAEIAPAYSAPSAPGEQPICDVAYLTNQKACPLLHSVYTEVLRLVSSTVSVRVVDEDTPNIGGYTLYKGAKVFCPGRPLQTSEEFWGSEAKEFKAERFVTRPQDGTGLKMRPFGGGPTLCPGRHFAALEVKTFVAGALMRFNFEFPEGMPEMDVKTPCLGVMRSVGVCMAKISPRAEWTKLCASTAEEKIEC
ncbi:hypothetical protein M407DRAFT_18804 [Tulasnella calospora MUT 4182]|uniref:Cytochrome P450 n=1 Tax=Tulasnella calospora MUT 4182 TaxID=1051891 RepID=A0A0C3QJ46_9AGAM|nr:hypothetical protein M407DRAFT_18804 [Tulasnella calospora MUT 4182]